MNSKLIKYIAPCLFVFAFSSCQDRLDYNEVTEYNSEQVFTSFTRTRNFVTNIYSKLENGLNDGYGRGALLASACDEAEFAWTNSNIHHFYNGAWSKNNTLSSTWDNMYNGIRAANYYLRESEGRTFEQFKNNTDYKEQMERFLRYQYEVRFLRAYFYFNLVRTYGDVPFITEVLTEELANQQKRESKDVIFQFIFDECDEIANELPVDYEDLTYSETGRITKIAVLALKARAAMYAASPLFAGGNDRDKWKFAAEANKKVIDECDKHGIVLGKYSEIWGTENFKCSEMILERRLGDLNYLEANNFPVGVEGGNSGNCPTQTLVDAYRMKSTGKLWNEDGSGYDATKPYLNRDPRFAMTIAYNGMTSWPNYNSLPLQIYEGGLNGAPTPGASPSGYYLKKFCDASVDLRPNKTNTKRHSWVIFRLGEFYLNYAECVFNYLGSADAKNILFYMSPVEALNKLRTREDVDMPEIPTGLSNDDFIKYYENERMVELAFEQHRFWDVRRWKKGELLKKVDLMKLTYDSNTLLVTYERYSKERKWEDKMYFFPISDVERRKNPNLTQNPGWE